MPSGCGCKLGGRGGNLALGMRIEMCETDSLVHAGRNLENSFASAGCIKQASFLGDNGFLLESLGVFFFFLSFWQARMQKKKSLRCTL
ncbi:hypothetical protein I7I50_10349 [Histoplasma capsulatum G186AR]|uniref:Uncharacterized protein n=1 Tax=Ajellomyces capsulatus TaxID=5037 RepID=A0A8H8D8H7_AJECA|nr:hypothetical protein I7I52_01588 [Histoplasma capsulatum]QSS69155.1 hypothetical protein I7I50_10349 [Histoplasma capsulatum G186AR]